MKKLSFLFLVLVFSFACKQRGGSLGDSSSSDPAAPVIVNPGLECPVCEECSEEVVCEECEECEEETVDKFCESLPNIKEDYFGLLFGVLLSDVPDKFSFEEYLASTNDQISGALLFFAKEYGLEVSQRGTDVIKNISAANRSFPCRKIFEPFRCPNVDDEIENNAIIGAMKQFLAKFKPSSEMKGKIDDAVTKCLTTNATFNVAFGFLFESSSNYNDAVEMPEDISTGKEVDEGSDEYYKKTMNKTYF